MADKRVIILCDCEQRPRIEAALQAAGARVEEHYELLGALCALVSPEAMVQLLAQYPGLQVIPDGKKEIPPLPLTRAEREAGRLDTPAAPARPATSPSQPQTSPLALDLMAVPAARALGFDGTGVRVCIIDSGVDFSHPDLAGTAALDEEGRPLAVDFTGTDLTDTLGHGTAVAGMIASQGRQVYQVADPGLPPVYTRILGVAPGVKLMSAKVFDTRVPGEGGWDSAIVAALEWAAKNGAHIVNLSLGGGAVPNTGRDPVAMAVAALRQRGIAVFAAAGNAGTGEGSIDTPGSAQAAITVGASTAYRSFGEIGYLAAPGRYGVDQVAGFSSLGPTSDGRVKPDLCAPGAFDWSLAPVGGSAYGRDFQLFGGTSQATPLAAGVAALVWQAFQQAHGRPPTPDELQAILMSTADDLGYPPHWQGAGRVSALRAVEAALGRGTAPIVVQVQGTASLVPAGTSRAVTVVLRNPGDLSLPVRCRITQPEVESHRTVRVVGRLTAREPVQDIPVTVPAGYDLIQANLSWTYPGTDGAAPRAVVALYDPEGNFINYQPPSPVGSPDLARMVEALAARPQPGTWTVRVSLRPRGYSGELPYALTVTLHRHRPWAWARVPEPVTIAPGAEATLRCEVAVPRGAQPGTHMARLEIEAAGRTAVVPLAVTVPIGMADGYGAFSGTFRHGLPDRWHGGDWRCYTFQVPAGVRTLVAAVSWPDPGQGVELFLVDPEGNTVLGKGTGATDKAGVQGHELVLARPRPGLWQVILHCVAFSGRAEPEPFTGFVAFGPDLAQPREVTVVATPGSRVPIALGVRNPGRVPVQARLVARSRTLSLRTEPFTLSVEVGLDAAGRGRGTRDLGPFQVPTGARLLGVFLMWDQPGAVVSVSLNDPVTGTTQAVAQGRDGLVLALERCPAPGPWMATVHVDLAGRAGALSLRGAWLLHAPEEVAQLSGDPASLLPGATGLVHGWLEVPTGQQGPLVADVEVLTLEGDQLAVVPLQVEVIRGKARPAVPEPPPRAQGRAPARRRRQSA